MSEQVKQQWIDALRSGQYVQGFGRLRDHDGRCCAMGVLCELAVREGIVERFHEPTCVEYGTEDNKWRGVPPPAVLDWVGVPTDTRWIWHMNDKDKLSFADIANELEQKLETRR